MSLPIPKSVLNAHCAILGKTGAGKSSLLRVIVEDLLKRDKRVCIIDPKGDWFGVKLSADGKSAGYPVITFGDFVEDKATDVPINEHSGKPVAELISSGNRPCVIGFRGWMPGKMTKFWIDFASTLFNSKSGELYLVIDEVHNFAPKGKVFDSEAGKCLHWSNRLLSEGRGLGLVILIASQRPQKVHNDTLTCCETLFAMRVVHAADRGAIEDWIDGCGDKERGALVLNSIAGMSRGEAFVWCPEHGFGPKRIQFPMFETFDSFAPPQLQKKVSAAGWAGVDLTAVKEKLAAVIEEQKNNDPAELKQKIRELERDLKKQCSEMSAQLQEKPSKPIEVPVLDAASRQLFEQVKTVFSELCDETKARHEELAMLGKWLSSANDRIGVLVSNADRAALAKAKPALFREVRRILHRDKPAESNGTVSGGVRRMMIALAQREGLSKKQLGVRAGLSSRSGTFSTYLAKLRTNGWIDGNDSISLTSQGYNALGKYDPLPEGRALLDYWLANLGNSGAARMLRVLADAYPSALSKEVLGEQANIVHTSGSFATYISKLKTLELIDGRSELRAAKEFFE